MKRYLFLFLNLFLLTTILELSSCRKTFLTNPSDKLINSDLDGPEGAQVILNGTYRLLRTSGSSHFDFGIPAMCLATDLMTADMAMSKAHWFYTFYNYQSPVLEQSSRGLAFWRRLYRIISNTNSVLDKSPPPRQKAQALALRAYAYLWLVNLYADHWKDSTTLKLPLSLTANQSTEPANLSNTKDIYNQIKKDLEESIQEFRKTQENRQQKSQIDSSVAHGLLARVCLYTKQWDKAIEHACSALGGSKDKKTVFDGSNLMDSTMFKAGFNNIDNSEWMWGLASNVQQSTIYASFFSMMDPTIQGYAGIGVYKCMSSSLYDSMVASDVRKQVIAKRNPQNGKFTDYNINTKVSYVQLKFRDPNSSWSDAEKFVEKQAPSAVVGSFVGAFPLMRKAEMYLIAAEACFSKNGGSGCNGCQGSTEPKGALCKLREKRGCKKNCTNNNCCNKDTVYLERRRELWGEGFALFDLKRLQKPMDRSKDSVHIVLTNVNNNVLYVSQNSDSMTFLVPRSELNINTKYNGRQPR